MAWVLDVSVVLALMHERHRHAANAAAWLGGREGEGTCQLCRVVQMGALRLLTHPAVMQEDVLSAADSWEGWDVVDLTA
jgi:predicted nucleic acid-binding protein